MEHNHTHENENTKNDKKENKLELVLTVLGIVIFIISFWLSKNKVLDEYILILMNAVAYILISYEIILNGIKNLFKFKALDENFLMTVATIGAFAMQEYLEAIMVILLYKVGEFLQDLAIDKSTEKIEKAIDIREAHANLKSDGKVVTVSSEELKIGDIIVIKNGEKVPVDGILVSKKASLDTSLITGESVTATLNAGEEILSGSINTGEVIEVRVIREYKDSTVSKIVDFIEKAGKNKSNTEKFITRFSKIYTPIVVAVAIIIMIFGPLVFNLEIRDAVSRGLIFLVISCPCALVISIPLGFFIGIGSCSKKGIVVKGSNYLDMLSTTNVIAFDKTGTLTKGNFKVVKIATVSDMDEEKLLETTAYAEYYSNHYIAKAVLDEYKKVIDESKISNYNEIAGNGIILNVDGKKVIAGKKELLEENGINVDEVEDAGTLIYVAVGGEYKGYLELMDEPKESSKDAIDKLKRVKITPMMLTGDKESIAKIVAYKLGIKECFGGLLPSDKADKICNLKEGGKTVAFVGDGINDSPVIAAADVGISMGSGAEISVEVADVVIMNNDPESVAESIKIAKKTKNIVKQNIIFALFVKVLFLALSLVGISNMWFAIFADVGAALITILNCLRISRI